MRMICKAALAVLLCAALATCAKTNTGGVARPSSGDIRVNETGSDGVIHENAKVFYTLRGIQQGQHYTLRTEISFLPGGQTPDGTLTAVVYPSEDAFKNNTAGPVASASPQPSPNANAYEVYFEAPSSGDYVVVLDGASSSIGTDQFFYNLRLMSADAVAGVLSPVTSHETGTTYAVQQTNPLNPGFLNIYNGVASSGTSTVAIDFVSGTINLVSNATATIVNPQMFVYRDSTLTISSLMLSSIPTTTGFIVTRFSAGAQPSVTVLPETDLTSSATISSVTISGVTFTGGGPFIVLKGFITAVTYTLSVGP